MGDVDLEDAQFPDCEELVPYVIGSNIMHRNGEKIRCFGQIVNINSNGDTFTIRSVDDQEISVRLNSPLSESLEGWVEVRGIARGKCINCEDFIAFPSELTGDVDKDGHKAFVQLLGALDDPWNLGEGEAKHNNDGITHME